jgi:TolB-like protein
MNDILQRDDAEPRGPRRWAGHAALGVALRASPARQMRLHGARRRATSSERDRPSEKKQIAVAIRDYIARERISREQFAFKAGLGKSTVDKLLIGLFSDKTLSIVESHIKLPLRAMIYRPHAPATSRTPESDARPMLPGCSIAVLPFANMGIDVDQQHVADGLVADIITALARVPGLLVVARTSTLVYKGQPVDVRRVGRDLGVRFVLDGSVRRAGARLRVTGQLIDAATGAHLWAGRHDGSLEDVFDLQDQIAAKVVAAVTSQLSADAIAPCADSIRLAPLPANGGR